MVRGGIMHGMQESNDTTFQRSKVYKLFSYMFFYPEKELFDFIKNGEFLSETKNAMHTISFSGQAVIDILAEFTKQCSLLNADRLQEEYIRLFESHTEQNPLYEANYVDFPQEEMADIAGFYNAFGFTFEERPDHIGAELEFMHLLTVKEAGISVNGDTAKNKTRLELCVDAQRKFLSAHIGRWVEALSEDIKKRCGDCCYYYLASALSEWVKIEARYLGITLNIVQKSMLKDIKEDMEICPAINK